jgi:hypothetical protein
MPEFQGCDPEHQAWKQAVLSGELELEEVDTAAHAFARPTLRQGPTAQEKKCS